MEAFPLIFDLAAFRHNATSRIPAHGGIVPADIQAASVPPRLSRCGRRNGLVEPSKTNFELPMHELPMDELPMDRVFRLVFPPSVVD